MTQKSSLKELWKKWFRKDNLVVLVLAGILLFVIALPIKDGKKEDASKEEANNSNHQQTIGADESDIYYSTQWETGLQQTYLASMEEKLKKTLENIEGVGKVEVMITLKSSEELVLEKDESINRSNTNEEDAEGGKRVVTQLETHNDTVYQTGNNESNPYVIKTLFPVVEGVVVVAQGANQGGNNKNITEIVKALFGVEAHKVRVVKMDDDR